MSDNTPKLTWDKTGQPLSSTFDDIYFSKKNGLEESRYVFLQGNHLPERFTELEEHQHFCVGEMGFGTGLNFLSSWELWQQKAPASAQLTFISTEKYPLSADELERSLQLWPELNELSSTLVAAYRQLFAPKKESQKPLFYTLSFGAVRLILIIGDAKDALNELSNSHWAGIDAWFLDGFAPAKNPDMWSQTLFNTMNKLSHASSTLATFTAAGHVRRGLNSAGFIVTKVKGFANKREMITGTFDFKNSDTGNAQNKEAKTPWATNRHHRVAKKQEHIAIIGAGLAGCHTAYALAKRGFKVTLIDAHNTVASEASGNPQGIVYAKLSAHAQKLSDFNLLCLMYAQQHYSHFWQNYPELGNACGVLQLSQTDRLKEQHKLIGKQYEDSHFLRYLNAEEASDKAGIKLKHPGLFFPHCGWLSPQILCKKLIDNRNITIHYNSHVETIEKQLQQWKLTINPTTESSDQQSWQKSADYIVIANANAANQFGISQWLPTKPIRGQITYLPSSTELSQLKTVVCAEGYIAPCHTFNNNEQHAIGASYNLNSLSKELSEEDHDNNIQQILQNLSLNTKTIDTIRAQGGRVGFRCTSPDYLPLVGPVPNIDAFKQDYHALTQNARRCIPTTGDYHAGLYLNVAHGSRGLAYTPLAAEIIACTLTGEALPLPDSLVEALNPARFIIRELCRTPRASH